MGRRVELQPVTVGIANATTQQDPRFAAPTGRAKAGVVFVNMLENTGGAGNVDFLFWTASDPNLDPNMSTTSGHWVQAVASAVSFATSPGGKSTKRAALTVVGEALRYSVVVPSGNTCRFSIVVIFYDT